MLSFALIVRLRPLKTHYCRRVGYRNQTSLNSILPWNPFYAHSTDGFSVYSTAVVSTPSTLELVNVFSWYLSPLPVSTFEGVLMIVKIFIAALVAFAVSGPMEMDEAAVNAPKIKQNMAIIIASY